MKKKTVIACILAAMVTLAIASRGIGSVKNWFNEKTNSQEESALISEKEDPVLIPELYAYANGKKITSADIYADGVLSFEVVVNNYEDATAEVVIASAPDGADGTIEEANGDYTFYPDGVGEYAITINSATNEELTATITVNVKKAPNVADFFDNDQYQNVGKTKENDLMVWIMTDATTQVLAQYVGEVYDYSANKYTSVKLMAVYDFIYDSETKAITLKAISDDDMKGTADAMCPEYTPDATLLNSITLNADYTLSVVYCNSNKQAVLETYVEEEQTESEVDTSSESEVSTESEDESAESTETSSAA